MRKQVIGTILWIAVQCGPMNSSDSTVALADIRALADAIDHRKVGRIEMLHIPERVRTITRVTPDMLSKQFHSMITVRDARIWRESVDLVKALRKTRARDSDSEPDLRWAIRFYDTSGRLITTLAVDSAPSQGYVNDQPVTFENGAVFGVVESQFGAGLK